MNKHRWTYKEKVIVFNGYLNGESAASISNETGISETQFMRKLSNFKYLMTGSGLENCSKDSIRVVEEYIESCLRRRARKQTTKSKKHTAKSSKQKF